jgi:hypothetical protein
LQALWTEGVYPHDAINHCFACHQPVPVDLADVLESKAVRQGRACRVYPFGASAAEIYSGTELAEK